MMKKDIYKDFDIFTRALIGSNDVDPTYPVIAHITNQYNFDKLWFAFVYVSFYNLKTAFEFCNRIPTWEAWNEQTKKKFVGWREDGTLKHFGHERRGTARNPFNQIMMYDAVKKMASEINEADGRGYGDTIRARIMPDNASFRNYIQHQIPFHGGWASFKIAEIFEKAYGYKQLIIPDLGIEERDPNSNDSAVGGLRWLYGRENTYDKSIYPIWNRFAENLVSAYNSPKVDLGAIETAFCKWHKTVSGKYFVGHDLQEFFELQTVMDTISYEEMMNANFATKLWQGKTQIEKGKKNMYARANILLNKDFGAILPRVDVLKILLETE